MHQLTPGDVVLFDSCLVSHLYTCNQRNDHEDRWWTVFDAIPRDRRMVNDIVRWELSRRPHREDAYSAYRWMESSFYSSELKKGDLKEYRIIIASELDHRQGFGGAADGLIAAHARKRDFVLATLNVRDFYNVQRLRLFVVSPREMQGGM